MTIITIHNIYVSAGLIEYTADSEDGGRIGPYHANIDTSVKNPAMSDYYAMASADATQKANDFVDNASGVISDIKAGGGRVVSKEAEVEFLTARS